MNGIQVGLGGKCAHNTVHEHMSSLKRLSPSHSQTTSVWDLHSIPGAHTCGVGCSINRNAVCASAALLLNSIEMRVFTLTFTDTRLLCLWDTQQTQPHSNHLLIRPRTRQCSFPLRKHRCLAHVTVQTTSDGDKREHQQQPLTTSALVHFHTLLCVCAHTHMC